MTVQSKIPVIQVDVSVDAASGNIICQPNPLPVNVPNAMIVFGLSTSGYAFPNQDAIVLDTPDPSFPFSSWTIHPNQANLLDRCSQPGLFDYTVNVIETATGRVLSVDPQIQNGTAQP